MDQIIETFHLDLKLLIAQLLNFIVVFLFLYLLAVKPISLLMRERTEKIEKGLKNADDFEKKLKALREEEERVLIKAKKEAQEIILQSKTSADEQRQISLNKTKKDVQYIIVQAKAEVASLKDKMVRDVKKESLELVLSVTKNILGDTVNKSVDEKVVKKYLENIE